MGAFHVTPDGESIVFHIGVVIKVTDLKNSTPLGGGFGAPGAAGPPGAFAPPGAAFPGGGEGVPPGGAFVPPGAAAPGGLAPRGGQPAGPPVAAPPGGAVGGMPPGGLRPREAPGAPAGGGAYLVGSLADLPYALAATEQDFIAPDHVQALIWKQFVPELMSGAIVPRWWDVSQTELHAAALYQRAGEEILTASAGDTELRAKVMVIISDRMFPARQAWLEEMLQTGKTKEMLEGIMPAETFSLTAEFQQRFPGELSAVSPAGRELQALSHKDPDEVSRERISRDFGIIHPVFTQSYGRELISVKPFPALTGAAVATM